MSALKAKPLGACYHQTIGGHAVVKQITMTGALIMLAMLTMLGVWGRGGKAGQHAAEPLPKPNIDLPTTQPGQTRTAVLAGGCFWCTDGAFAQFRGVKD